MMKHEWESLRKYAYTDRQLELVDYKLQGMSNAEVARKLGVRERSVERHLQKVRVSAAKRGWSPDHDMHHTVPDGFKVKGTSTLYKDGEPVIQWVKSDIDNQRQLELMREAIEALNEEIKPECKISKPKVKKSDLAHLFVITDYHAGMLAWHEEVGADWDLQIAEDTLVKWFAQAIEQSSQADVAVFAQLGDFLHFDSLEAVTPASRHILDADTRFQKLVRTVIRVIRRVVRMLLEKYPKVHIKWCDANHDPASSAWMREFLTALYDKEPRIEVDNSADTYYCFEWGKTALFFHHGHKRKVANVDTVFASKFREVFGRTEHAYAHMGHYHSIDIKETNLMLVTQHRTLAAPDAYASRGGWMSGREAQVITYHKEYGQVGSQTISYKMIC
jgi:hypothetical protein